MPARFYNAGPKPPGDYHVISAVKLYTVGEERYFFQFYKQYDFLFYNELIYSILYTNFEFIES